MTSPPPMKHWFAFTCQLVVLACLFSAFDGATAEEISPAAVRPIDFAKDVQPIFAASCYSCHGQQKQTSGYRLDVQSIALKGGDTGSRAIVPGNSADSPLIQYVSGSDESMQMPPEGKPLSAEQIGILRAWIDQGASWPEELSAKLANPKEHWAYRPLELPAVPMVKNAAWRKSPIDAFILAKLEEHQMRPASAADKRTLLRRVYFDLIGLPPTPDELKAFEADRSPDAYEKIVDRLLASPHYGERWARHWMDIVHFAETHGNDQDRPRPNAWPYRDYLIRAFNSDKPYARFVQDQLAGDVLYPDDPDGVVALGFIAAGPWDESSQMSIQDNTLDKKIAKNLDRDDMLTTTMSTFASSTVHCARCHNHKFDPISQQEYYNLQSVFAGIDRAERLYDPEPVIHARRIALLKQKKQLEGPAAMTTSMLRESSVQAEVAAWEASLAASATMWEVLDPSEFTSSGGATPEKQSDASILYGGTRPEKDTYTIVAHTSRKGMTAVRLEVLTDPSLPVQGPGRCDNGNLHLSEFSVKARTNVAGAEDKPVPIKRATADFDQEGWTSALAIDGRMETAWGIHPAEGKPHAIVFELKEAVEHEAGTVLTFTLEQNHGGGHLIGRPRLSVTTAPPPIREVAVSPPVANILSVPADQRTDAQKAELALHVLKLRVEEQLAALPPPQRVFAGANDFKQDGAFAPAKGCRPVHVLKRGDVNAPGEPAVPGALACVPNLASEFDISDPHDEGARRAALAKWLTDPKNVLTWRSIVNRVWHYHFGHGIVVTPNDLGHMGAKPTHPELLDWLAITFRDGGGSFKSLHKQIVTSAAYTQSSKHNAEYAKIDGGNALLWRMNRTRLDAEAVRDTVLVLTSKLDPTMGGPSVKQFIESPGIHVTPNVDYLGFNVDDPAMYRRSVYRFLFRTLPDPFMDALDCPDASQLAPTRNDSVTALQALASLNNAFMVRQSEHLTMRLAAEAGADLSTQVERLYQLTLNRTPTEKEKGAWVAYATRHGMANVCRLLLNSNEFMFVD
jgi:mono/diheme cytochrome c family protein